MCVLLQGGSNRPRASSSTSAPTILAVQDETKPAEQHAALGAAGAGATGVESGARLKITGAVCLHVCPCHFHGRGRKEIYVSSGV